MCRTAGPGALGPRTRCADAVVVSGATVALDDPDASPVGERLSYVKGLDGVRAFAVAAVMAFHGGVTHVTGGFLGVDVFFVPLRVPHHLAAARRAPHTGTIRLGAFWARRARRLLPALLLVLCFVGLYAWLAAPRGCVPGAAPRLAGHALLRRQLALHPRGPELLPAALAPSPLTHTWSLAIEEQFYLVWPLVVLGLRSSAARPASCSCVAAARRAGVHDLDGMAPPHGVATRPGCTTGPTRTR